THARQPLWRRGLPAHARPHKNGKVAPSRLPLGPRLVPLANNSFRVVVLNGLRSWARDIRLTAPALGSMAMTLLLCGMLALVGISMATVAGQEPGQASIVRVYLAANAAPDAVATLETRLRADVRVASVTEVSA